jgi:hypothetical protein
MSWIDLGPGDRRQIREFGTGLAIILLAVSGVRALRGHDPRIVPLGIAAAVALLLAWGAPRILLPLFRVWMLLAGGLLWINTRLLLGIVFFLLVLPMGILARLFGRDPMERRFDRSAPTYWSRRPPLPREPGRYRHQY